MNPLNSPAVNGMDLEGSALALWNEFLARYFDGSTHDVGPMKAVQFPRAVLRYQESALPQPLAAGDIGISLVWVSPTRVSKYWDTLSAADAAATGGTAGSRQERWVGQGAFLFLIRATTSAGSENSQRQVQSAAGKLYGLLQNTGATLVLAEKGLGHLRPAPPRMAWPGDGAPEADLGYRLRVLSCAVEVSWAVVSQR